MSAYRGPRNVLYLRIGPQTEALLSAYAQQRQALEYRLRGTLNAAQLSTQDIVTELLDRVLPEAIKDVGERADEIDLGKVSPASRSSRRSAPPPASRLTAPLRSRRR